MRRTRAWNNEATRASNHYRAFERESEMKRAARFLSEAVRDPMALVFGLAVFTFSWTYRREPEWNDHKLTFVAGALLSASVLILVRRGWSNFAAAALGGYLPVQLAYEFWMLPRQAEVPFLSLRHLEYFARGFVQADAPVLLFLALSVLVLACSARTLKRPAPA